MSLIQIDMFEGKGALIPTGTVLDFAGSIAPPGFIICDGAAISRTDYETLFNVIGTTFGIGDGSTTFNLPDARGRTTIGAGQGDGLTNRTLAEKLGSETVALTESQLASHNHIASGIVKPRALNGKGEKSSDPTARWMADASSDIYADSHNVEMGESPVSVTVQNAGSGEAHDNIQSSIVFNKIIKT